MDKTHAVSGQIGSQAARIAQARQRHQGGAFHNHTPQQPGKMTQLDRYSLVRLVKGSDTILVAEYDVPLLISRGWRRAR